MEIHLCSYLNSLLQEPVVQERNPKYLTFMKFVPNYIRCLDYTVVNG